MCGISGFIPLSNDITNEKVLEIMKFLLRENEIRGRDATGTASWDLKNNEVLVCKQADEAKDFVENLKPEHILGPTIGHNRAQTRGSPDNPENNHPMVGEKFCLIHNGMVHSMKNLDGYTYKGQCDTEVLLSYFERFGVKGAIPKIDGSAALAIFSPEDRNFYLYRHTSPLSVVLFPGKALAFSSTENPLKKLGNMLGVEKIYGIFNPQTITDLEEGQLFTFNIDTHSVSVETIKPDSKPYVNEWYANQKGAAD